MSEQSPESTGPTVNTGGGDAVVNTAPDGGGVDNNNAAPESQESAPESNDSDSNQ